MTVERLEVDYEPVGEPEQMTVQGWQTVSERRLANSGAPIEKL